MFTVRTRESEENPVVDVIHDGGEDLLLDLIKKLTGEGKTVMISRGTEEDLKEFWDKDGSS